jgi:hypothetical protein
LSIEQAKQLLTEMGFTVVEGEWCIILGEHAIKEPIIGVSVSLLHRCYDETCNGVHIVGTKTAIEAMPDHALREMIVDELASNR